MIYNDFDFSPYFVDEDIREPLLPEIKHSTTDVPGEDGMLFNGLSLGTRVIEIDIRIIRENRRALNELIPFLASKLFSRTPSRLYTRLHSGEYYIAVLSGAVDIEKWLGTGFATLTFIAYSPARYCDNRISAALSTSAKTVEIKGTYPTKPLASIDVRASCSYLAITDVTTGETMRSERSFSSGNRVVFDCERKVALLYATASATTATKIPITMQSRWFELQPGAHQMRIVAASSAHSATLEYAERRL